MPVAPIAARPLLWKPGYTRLGPLPNATNTVILWVGSCPRCGMYRDPGAWRPPRLQDA